MATLHEISHAPRVNGYSDLATLNCDGSVLWCSGADGRCKYGAYDTNTWEKIAVAPAAQITNAVVASPTTPSVSFAVCTQNFHSPRLYGVASYRIAESKKLEISTMRLGLRGLAPVKRNDFRSDGLDVSSDGEWLYVASKTPQPQVDRIATDTLRVVEQWSETDGKYQAFDAPSVSASKTHPALLAVCQPGSVHARVMDTRMELWDALKLPDFPERPPGMDRESASVHFVGEDYLWNNHRCGHAALWDLRNRTRPVVVFRNQGARVLCSVDPDRVFLAGEYGVHRFDVFSCRCTFIADAEIKTDPQGLGLIDRVESEERGAEGYLLSHDGRVLVHADREYGVVDSFEARKFTTGRPPTLAATP